jgi:hypothetical protein
MHAAAVPFPAFLAGAVCCCNCSRCCCCMPLPPVHAACCIYTWHAAACSMHVHVACCSIAACNMCTVLPCNCGAKSVALRRPGGGAGNVGGQRRRPACMPGGPGRGAPLGAPRELRDAGLCGEGGAGCRGVAGPPPLCSLPASTTLLPSTQAQARPRLLPAVIGPLPTALSTPTSHAPTTAIHLPGRACAGGGAARDREEGPLFAPPPGSFRSFRSRITERPFAQFLFDLQPSPVISLEDTKFDSRRPAPTL